MRYADDWLLGFIGPKSEAEEIKKQLTLFLRDELKLELSKKKTLITHARTKAARFLGYDIAVQHNDTKQRNKRRCVNGIIALRVPRDVIQAKCANYMKNNQPHHFASKIFDSDFAIVADYQAEYRGIVQYYKMANNLWHLHRLYHVMHVSLAKTLAKKHKSSVRKICKKYSTFIDTPYGPLKVLQITVPREGNKKPLSRMFGGIPLRRETKAIIHDNKEFAQLYGHRSDLLTRLLADKCELCGATENCEVHHIHKLADVNKPGRKAKLAWAVIMSTRRRKTLIVCKRCHHHIQHGDKTKQRNTA